MLKPLVACLAVGGLALVACTADKTDFQKKATEVVVKELQKSDEGATVVCDKPTSTDVGTTFDCTATLSDGTKIPLQAKITKKNFVEVDAAPTSGTDPEDIANRLVSAASLGGFEVDHDCALHLAEQLSDEDRAAIAAADPNTAPELSPAGEALTEQAATCLAVTDETRATMADEFATTLGITDDTTKQCIADAIGKLSDDQLRTVVVEVANGSLPDDLKGPLVACAA
jgi:hypothetical protein